jgi:prepilin-type N-terminal cleavage/methylation domain-containing protein
MIFARSIKTLRGTTSGFTLLEVIVAATLFLVILVFGTSIFVSISNTQRASAEAQKVFGESRFLVDMLADQIRSASLDYQSGYPAAQPETRLHLIRTDGTSVRYYLESILDSDGITRGHLKQQVGTGSAVVLSSLAIDIAKLDFYVHPFVQDGTTIPSVTIVFEAKETGPQDPTTLNLQTTVNVGNY